ncbi:hypothetical protein L9F63_020597, partial [Diploptera punctata]
VMIHATNQIECSGFVVSETAVITSASCFDSLNGDFSTVYVMNAGGGSVHLHEDYSIETKENNIAIILLNNAIVFQEGITLAAEDPQVNTECVVAGYGVTQPDAASGMVASYENVVITDCGDNLTGRVCAGAKGDTDTLGILCLGDLGAPLVCNNELVGIGVTDSSCGAGSPDLYQDIKDLNEWIQNMIQ